MQIIFHVVSTGSFHPQHGNVRDGDVGGTKSVGEAHNRFDSTVGNVVGGALLVGLPFTYLNPREREEQMVRVDLRVFFKINPSCSLHVAQADILPRDQGRLSAKSGHANIR